MYIGNITIHSMSSYSLKIKQPIPVFICCNNEDIYAPSYTVSFLEANIGSSGDNIPQAISSLKAMIASTYIAYSKTPVEKLGPKPIEQLSVLRDFLEVIEASNDYHLLPFHFLENCQSKPLTFKELNIGDCFIPFPCDGDDSGHGGFQGSHNVFEKISPAFCQRVYSSGLHEACHPEDFVLRIRIK